jgi:probable F420-dependent oxidoreductase
VTAAEATETLRIGTFVLNNDLRHPALVPRDAAALDFLSDGRFELGLGAGHRETEYDEIGLAFEPSRIRVARLAEAVTIVKRLLEGEHVTFSGEHYTLRSHHVHPRPVQRPRPPLLIGGNSRRLLELAGREADIVSFLGFSHLLGGRDADFAAFSDTGTIERTAIVRTTAGRRFADVELNVVVQRVAVGGSARAAADELAHDWQLDVDDLLGSPYVLFGSVDGIADELRKHRERHGFSYWVIGEASLDAFAPVVVRLAGS